MKIKKYFYIIIFVISSTKISQALIKPQLIDIHSIDSSIEVDLFLADSQNFLGQSLYPTHAKAYIDKNVGIILQNIQKELSQYGLGLKIKDAYRPFYVQKMLWKKALSMNLEHPENYVSDPIVEGGRHPRGIAVDVTLVRLDDHTELAMPPMGFIPEAHHGHAANLSAEQIKNREFLKNIMTKHGFVGISCEWWHYNLPNWRDYQALDITFEELNQNERN
jgi:D-alanyl-D-alanine dipeptidase